MIQGKTSKSKTQETHMNEDPLLSMQELGLTILAHPDPNRVGEYASLLKQDKTKAQLSREKPTFRFPHDQKKRDLETKRLSRSPIRLEWDVSGDLYVDPLECVRTITVNGQRLRSPCTYSPDQLDQGLVISMSEVVVLLLHRRHPREPGGITNLFSDGWLAGQSNAIVDLASRVPGCADCGDPILIVGEPGVGKMQLAEVIHRSGYRKQRPLVHAYLGSSDNDSSAAHSLRVQLPIELFQKAGKGTLLIHELNDASPGILDLLLKSMTKSKVLTGKPSEVPSFAARIIATWTRHGTLLESEVSAPQSPVRSIENIFFSLPVPPLRRRKEDLGSLFYRFLQESIERTRPTKERLEFIYEAIPPLMAPLARYDWPGNVRQLRAAVLDLDLKRPNGLSPRGDSQIAQIIQSVTKDRDMPPPGPTSRFETTAIAQENARRALIQADGNISQAARQCGMSYATFYRKFILGMDEYTCEHILETLDRSPSIAEVCGALMVARSTLIKRLNECRNASLATHGSPVEEPR